MTDDEKRAEFHRLTAEAGAIRAKAAPHRAEHDALRGKQCEIDEQLATVKQRLKSIEAPLFDLDQRRAALVRDLKGKTGRP